MKFWLKIFIIDILCETVPIIGHYDFRKMQTFGNRDLSSPILMNKLRININIIDTSRIHQIVISFSQNHAQFAFECAWFWIYVFIGQQSMQCYTQTFRIMTRQKITWHILFIIQLMILSAGRNWLTFTPTSHASYVLEQKTWEIDVRIWN